MKIAVIGCGAMGALYGGYLSRNNDVTLVERNPDRIEALPSIGRASRATRAAWRRSIW